MRIRFLLILCAIALAAPLSFSQSDGVNAGKAPHPVIKNKPEPDWPRTIKKKSELRVVLRAIFTSDGKVTHITFIEARPKETTDYSEEEIKDLVAKAKEAARQIKFIPATKDGKNVSMWMELEYAFQLDEKETTPSQESKKP